MRADTLITKHFPVFFMSRMSCKKKKKQEKKKKKRKSTRGKTIFKKEH